MGCDIFVIDVYVGFQEKLYFKLMGCDIFVIEVVVIMIVIFGKSLNYRRDCPKFYICSSIYFFIKFK